MKTILLCMFTVASVTAYSVCYDRNNGQTVNLWQGDELVVKLLVPADVNGLAGVWTLSSNSSGTLLRERTQLESSGTPGTMYQVFRWRAVGTGSTEIRMQYTGSGVYDPPSHLYRLQVVVH